MTDEELLTALKEVKEKCEKADNNCLILYKNDQGPFADRCIFYDANYGCILKEYPERWRI